MPAERAVTFESSGGVTLEGMLHEHPHARIAALVMHPHPQYGGDMDNHVVLTICAALAAAGATTLRFNVRGTGGSGGSFDAAACADDVRAGFKELTAPDPDARVLVAGYSFGAQLAAELVQSERAAALVLVSPPLAYAELPIFAVGLPLLAIAGDADAVCPADKLRALDGDGRTVRVLPGVDHGWMRGTEQLMDEISSFTHILDE